MTVLPPQPLSPLDGRYRSAVLPLGDFLSEAGLNRARVHVEVEWLAYLTSHSLLGSTPLTDAELSELRAWAAGFGEAEIEKLAEIEAVTQHDVKAVEYLVREQLERQGLSRIAELTHVCCTSEDINNLSYALTIKQAVAEVWLPKLQIVIDELERQAAQYRELPMMARTHGQPATPTTLGKELAVFVHRLNRQVAQIGEIETLGKFSGATGTFAAHLAADPDADWLTISREFVEGLGLDWNPLTTQIESHDWQAELYSRIAHTNRILHNLATDVWTYISIGYFRQIPVEGATGSSTMPHKVNPIRFENAEANLELSNAILESLAQTLVTSRLQRDLTDSSAQRNIGVGLGHSVLALDNIKRGLGQIDAAPEVLAADLNANWEVLGEAIQTVIRAEVTAGRSTITDPYAALKDLTRGRRIGQADLIEFVQGLEIGDAAKARLLALTPETYTGAAAELLDLL
ncbi:MULTISPECIES: adenylosuccinate lyase [unclassified Leucobacter]|uniref:adenylosuccinate lyase n=1 Tax=unclassified Leucobacter TaxID=2621730 RepID=UPI00165DADE4|nr:MULTISPECIES: adenylosuccinate lyase [unclassified Leucobacter]MBC9927005.1 adenylosuccinate lyase [Leucobacter sp. cx-169]MBC9936284.1 adenylosuccinate lyase [Leucobacter sp. cx-87]